MVGWPDGGGFPSLDAGPIDCTDNNGDMVPDVFEHTPLSDDDDGDGFTNTQEAIGDYPGFTSHMIAPLIPECHHAPLDCDGDHLSNMEDTDSDNDGVPDGQERTLNTDPCNEDTDGDGVTDLVEVAAGSSPTDGTSMPPSGSLYVTVPYHPPGTTGEHPQRQFEFHTRIQSADVFFLVDNSASMQPIIMALRSAFSSTIVPGLAAAIPDLRLGVGSFDSIPDGIQGDPGNPGDYTLWVRQRMDVDPALSQAAFNSMNTIDTDTASGFFGGDYPEDQVESTYEALTGNGMPGHLTDEAARRSVHNALDPSGNGYVPTMDPIRDCGAAPDQHPYGWACFEEGRVPIIVLASDAEWYNGFNPGGAFGGSPHDPNSHDGTALVAAMNMHGAYFVGIDVGDTGDTFANSQTLSSMTGTVDGAGNPIDFHPGSAGVSAMAANQIVNAITTLAGQTRQDITTRTDPDTSETRLAAGHTTADFIRAVTPDHGVPDAPTGYDSKDATTFYNVDPATIVYFNVDFYNDFQEPTNTAQLFRATIQVLGRAGSIVDHRDVYMIVPPMGAFGGPI
jgi:hypothetical protein